MQVRIESPFPWEALPRLWTWMEKFRDKVTDDFSPTTLDDFILQQTLKWADQRSWGVYADNELGGLITFEKFTPWVGTAHFLLKDAFQRQGISIQAARLAADRIFQEEGIGKLVFHPLAGNLAIGSLVCNLGARREGTLVGHTLCHGKPTDIWVYGLTKEEFYASSSANNRGSRRGVQPPGVGSVGKAEADHPNVELQQQQHVHPDVHPGGTEDPAAAPGVLGPAAA